MIELLVVLAVIVIMTTVAWASATSSRGHVTRVQCASNLRQIGIGLNLYSAEYNDYVPTCGWPDGQNPWQTYSAARITPGTSTVTRGFMSLGLLFRRGMVPDARIFYCPALARISDARSYEYYSSGENGWPSTPPGMADEQIRTGYNYYPQLLAVQPVAGHFLPRLRFTPTTLEYGGSLRLVAPAKVTDLDLRKSIVTDLVNNTADLAHRSAGSVDGLNALFPDGRVVFQDARRMPEPFALVEASLMGIGNDSPPSLSFRRVMASWQ